MRRIQMLLKEKAEETNTPLWIIEKDYALSYLLAGISEVPSLKGGLALKGGTAIKKAYYQNARFSEDLDFSLYSQLDEAYIREGIKLAGELMQSMLVEKGPFSVQCVPLELRLPHPKKQIAYTIRVQFPYHREAICRLKVEITVDEPVFLAPESRLILHDYDEVLTTFTSAYQLPEIAAEKYRALIQSLERLRNKGWGANRVCRDYYDLWWILGRENLINSDIPSLVDRKCAVKGVTYEHPDTFFDDSLTTVAQREWDKLLTPFIPEKIPLEKVLSDLQLYTQNLFPSCCSPHKS